MVHDVLISLEFCVEVDPSILPESMADSLDVGHKHIFFPALVSGSELGNLPKVFDLPSKTSHILAWQLVVDKDAFISPRLLQAIILRLASNHIFNESQGSTMGKGDYSKVWHNGIFWQSTQDVNAAVQVHDNAVIQVIGSSKVNPECLCTYISAIIEDIVSTIRGLSPGLSGTTYMIHPVNPQVLLEQPESPSSQEKFPIDVLMSSMKNGVKFTLSCDTRKKMAIRKPISVIFGGFKPSVRVIERLSALSCE